MTLGPLHRALAQADTFFLWGLGVEGLATLAYLRELPNMPAVVVVADKEPDRERLVSNDLDHVMQPKIAVEHAKPGDVMLRSPGVPLRRPEVAGFEAKGCVASTATNLGFERVDPNRVVLVTGTKGKSTTSNLIARALSTGFETELVGNIGTPFLHASPRAERIVLELSSYQCADLARTAGTRVLTNLYPEHLDWHGDQVTYFRDKTRALSLATTGSSWVNGRDQESLALADAWHGPRHFNIATGLHFQEATVFDGDRALGDLPNLHSMGAHMRANALAAIAVALENDLTFAQIAPALEAFESLPHRQDILGERDGIIYVDDSISTIPQSALAALARFSHKRVHLLIGGKNRGVDPKELFDHLRPAQIAGLYIMGETVDTWLEQLKVADFPVITANTLENAVAQARKFALPGEIVLLSPAAASYDQFANFQERGREFKRLAGFTSAAG